MKAFIAICVAMLALVSVNCDPAADLKAFLAKKTAEYTNMTDADIKTHLSANVKAVENIIDVAVKKYMKEDLQLVATIDLDAVKFIDEGMPKIFEDLDKMDAKDKHINYVKIGVVLELLKYTAEMEDKKRAVTPLKVTDTEENLLKKYKSTYSKILESLKWAVEAETKKKDVFWTKVHQKIYDFMAPGLNEIEAAVEHLPKAIRAKNLQLLDNDLTLILEVTDTRPKSLYARVTVITGKVTEKVKEIASKVKAFFSKFF